VTKADLGVQGKVTRVGLPQVMHVPDVDGETIPQSPRSKRIWVPHIQRMESHRRSRDHMPEATLGGKTIQSQDEDHTSEQKHLVSAIKREFNSDDLSTWHRQLGHLGDSSHLKKLVGSKIISASKWQTLNSMVFANIASYGKMDEKPFEEEKNRDFLTFYGTLHADLYGPMNPESRWTHTRFSPCH